MSPISTSTRDGQVFAVLAPLLCQIWWFWRDNTARRWFRSFKRSHGTIHATPLGERAERLAEQVKITLRRR